MESCGLALVSDLFGSERFFADSDAFWTLQSQTIDARKTAYLEAGWSDVVVMERGDWFRSWEHAHAPKRKGGRVYVEVRDSGEVTFHEGYLTMRDAETRARGNASDEPAEKPQRPEVTRAMNDYLGLHRHAAVRADLLRHGGVALRAMVAHVIAGADHYRVEVEARRAPKPEIAESAETACAEAAFDVHRRAVLDVLGFDPDASTATGSGYDRPAFAPVFARLLELPDAVVMSIVAVVMGETLAVGSEAVEAIGLQIDTDMRRHWQADEAFLGLIRDREVLRAIVAEVAGEDVAEANAGETAKVLKAIIADHLHGTNGRTKVQAWAPRWMEFPPAAYTERGGVASVDAQARALADIAHAERENAARGASAASRGTPGEAEGVTPDSAPAPAGSSAGCTEHNASDDGGRIDGSPTREDAQALAA